MDEHEALMLIEGALDDMDMTQGERLDEIERIIKEVL
jgi:hypothetical protein